MEITSESIEDCLSQMEIDWMPFHDIYRSLVGFAKEEPTQVELEMTLRLTELLLKDYGIICLKGPEMTPFEEGIDDTISKIRRIVELEPYNSYSYSLWFDKLEQEPRSTTTPKLQLSHRKAQSVASQTNTHKKDRNDGKSSNPSKSKQDKD